jgi:hypothetical protein
VSRLLTSRHPVATELQRIQQRLGQSHAHTCADLRSALAPVLAGRGYEDPADGRARDALEVLKAILEHLRCPDVLWAATSAEIWQDGHWRDRRLPATVQHGAIWTVQLPTAARTLRETLRQATEQQVEGQLDAEDRQEMLNLHGRCRTGSYARRRDTLCLERVDGDLLLLELERLYLGPHGEQKRSVTALAPEPLHIGGDSFVAISLVCHAHHHYTCLVWREDKWWMCDDRTNTLQPVTLPPFLPQVVLYVYKKVLVPKK